jgi:hypothetical protein
MPMGALQLVSRNAGCDDGRGGTPPLTLRWPPKWNAARPVTRDDAELAVTFAGRASTVGKRAIATSSTAKTG